MDNAGKARGQHRCTVGKGKENSLGNGERKRASAWMADRAAQGFVLQERARFRTEDTALVVFKTKPDAVREAQILLFCHCRVEQTEREHLCGHALAGNAAALFLCNKSREGCGAQDSKQL